MEKDKQKVLSILQEVTDPELPVLSVVDLGIIRDVQFSGDELEVIITPTYSGCPAMNRIVSDIRNVLEEHGYAQLLITTLLSPAWTTDWMSEAGKIKLKAYGIAPPNPVPTVCSLDLFAPNDSVECPQCNSYNTKLVSLFGSTACKALYKCNDCNEPFEYFKCH